MEQKHKKEKVKQVNRGDIYTCSFKEGTGSEQWKNRPIIIVQNDIGNRFSPTCIVAVISSQRKNSVYPMHVDIDKEVGNLFEDSTILCEQLFTVDKTRLRKFISNITEQKEIMNEINNALKVSLGIS